MTPLVSDPAPPPAAPPPAAPAGVRVQAPARLHLGFLDPAAALGRRFGSLGLVVDHPQTVVELRRCHVDRDSVAAQADAGELARARRHLEALRRASGIAAPLHLHLEHTLPRHAGLGSGTQLALAVGRAYCALFDLRMSSHDVARLTGRGLRSGIGIAGFDQGGLLLDGGPRADGTPAPLLSRLPLPSAWRVLLVFDPSTRGLSGDAERAALARLAPLPRAAAAEICHQVLMRVLPGAAADEFEPFAAGLNRMQRVLGDHFAAAQGGRAYSSAAVARLLDWAAAHTPAAVGQSSWGPTGFAILPGEAEVQALLTAAADAGLLAPPLQWQVVRSHHTGAALTLL